jgi:hypothetical protein
LYVRSSAVMARFGPILRVISATSWPIVNTSVKLKCLFS